jgi:hypothetical protein
MVALAIVGLVAVVLLVKRVDVVQDAAKTRDHRLAWTLAAWKMGEIERDKALFEGSAWSDSGDCSELSPEYAAYLWEYQMDREKVATNDPDNPDEQPKEIWLLKLKILRPDQPPLVEMHAMFPVPAAKP